FAASGSEVIVTSGASEALHIAVQAHVNPGEEVIIPDPGFVSYDALTKVADARPVPVELADDLRMEPESVKEAIGEETSAIIVNSPANPTGAVQTEEDMRAFAEIAADYDIPLISDEVYDRFVYDGGHYSPAKFDENEGGNVVTVNAASKTFAMTGWRLGYVIASEARCDEMIKVHQYVQACASAPSQYAVLEALTSDESDGAVDEMKREFEARRDLVLEGLDDIGLECPEPRGAFYAFPKVPEGFIDECLERDVIVVPGDAFGDAGEGYARLSYANSRENLREALDVMGEVVAELS
ncbi:MAG: aminotransferase class I/II-fold pyridoxal phosphate-dependent enzyme, partial [Halobacteria archaeon]|nr:aminotransferase class I/II-fold pyridoxal phosphate-dependent enzyme [Halobacteria archaeon]